MIKDESCYWGVSCTITNPVITSTHQAHVGIGINFLKKVYIYRQSLMESGNSAVHKSTLGQDGGDHSVSD